MKAYRTETGCWINLSLCTRFYIEKDKENWDVFAAIDYAKDECQDTIILCLSENHPNEEKAQQKLDSILKYVAHDN